MRLIGKNVYFSIKELQTRYKKSTVLLHQHLKHIEELMGPTEWQKNVAFFQDKDYGATRNSTYYSKVIVKQLDDHYNENSCEHSFYGEPFDETFTPTSTRKKNQTLEADFSKGKRKHK